MNKPKSKPEKMSDLIDEVIKITSSREIDLERVFELKFGSLKVARTSKKEPPGLRALLKIVKTYPWMINIADMNWNEIYSKKIVCHAAIEELFRGR